MVTAEAFAMPTPHGTRFNRLKQIYPSSGRVSLYNLHNYSSFSLDDLTGLGALTKISSNRDVHFVQLPDLGGAVRGSAAACVKIVPQLRNHRRHFDMTVATLPLTARVACAG